ncbi:type IV secretion system protein [Bordetella parapertussis]|uniref:Trwi protein n=1 Tax=Bordetella parapertussis (strain Bpp5) TaxID=1208660 RepID=K0MPU7_BORPB|nr:type IV secretion system protein [Bordetella parapertussis]CCJ51900.1 trwi protein [Bordetella parapertussis Bpp5]
MSFQLLGSIFSQIDTVTQTFITDISSKAIAEITPVVSVGLTLGFITYGWLIIRGAVEMPVAEFLNRCLRVGIIVSIALAGGLYQSEIADAIVSAPDALATALISDPTQGSSAAQLVDQAAEKGFNYAGQAFDKAGIFSVQGIAYVGIWAVIMVATIALTAIGGAFILLAKIALALLAGLGPLFIIALLWQPTHRFFELWAGQVLNYGLLIIIFSAVFGLMMDLYGGYMDGAKLDGVQNASWTVGGAGIISAACLVILLQLPSIASGLAGGVGLGYMWELRAIRGGAGSAYRGGRTAARAARAAPGAARSAAVGATNMAKTAAGGAAGVARAAAGYFRGRKT